MKIKISDLKAVLDAIFNSMKDDGIYEFELEKDYYWKIGKDEIYDHDDPKDLTLGQLYDDWHLLKTILNDESEADSFHLEYLAPILRYIADYQFEIRKKYGSEE